MSQGTRRRSSLGALAAASAVVACACGGGKSSDVSETSYALGGTVSGLTAAGLVLRLNAVPGEDLPVGSGATAYAFTGKVKNGQYVVTIQTQPTGLTCTLARASVTVNGANVTDANLSCAVCSGSPGGACSATATRACAYDKQCPTGETCTWAQSIPRFVDNGDGTVTDRRTCLMWEKKTGTPGSGVNCTAADVCPDPHAVNNKYTWSTGSPWSFDGTAATVFLRQLNDAVFAGRTDWRLPASAGSTTSPTAQDPELESILTAVAPSCSPCIHPIFEPTATNLYWTSSPVAAKPGFAWLVYFFNGNAYDVAESSWFHVRAVRGGP